MVLPVEGLDEGRVRLVGKGRLLHVQLVAPLIWVGGDTLLGQAHLLLQPSLLQA